MNFTGNNTIKHESNFNQLRLDEYIDNAHNKKQWEIVIQPDSVSVLVENITNKTFVLVEQYRRPMALRDDKGDKVIELVAGLVDKKGKLLIETASEEVIEETGYIVDSIQYVLDSPKSAGQTTACTNDFFATVSGNPGNQNLGTSESIIVHEVKKMEIYNFLDYKKQQGFEVDSGIKMMLGEYARMKNPEKYMKMFA